MKIISLLMISLLLAACDGITVDETSFGNDTKRFTSTELTEKVFFSEKVRERNVQNGFILLFKDSSNVEEIGFVLNSDTRALDGQYSWDIVNDKLQLTYPSSIVCTSEKEDDDNQKLTVKNAVCTGGSPTNAKIQGIIYKAISLTSSSLSGRTVTIEIEGNQEVLDFNSDGSFLLTKKENELSISTENGVYKDSVYTNVVRLEFPDSNEYALLILMEGSLSSGQLLDLRYNLADNKLQAVRIYAIGTNDVWKVDDLFSAINTDN